MKSFNTNNIEIHGTILNPLSSDDFEDIEIRVRHSLNLYKIVKDWLDEADIPDLGDKRFELLSKLMDKCKK